MSGIKHPIDKKDIGKFEHQKNISVNVYGCEDKKVLPLRISTMTVARHHVNLLHITAGKRLITYWWKTWADCYRDYIIITTANSISANIVYISAPVKRYWKTIWTDASYTGHKESNSKMLMTRSSVTKSGLQKQKSTTFTFCHLCGFQKCLT